MKGVLLCGGNGTRLYPATKLINKHLLPILNIPLVIYPIETLKKFLVNDVLLVTGGENIGDFSNYLGDGSDHGISLTYKVQKNAGGIAEALLLAEDFVGNDDVIVILGDNFFDLPNVGLFNIPTRPTIYVKEVDDPQRFGVYYKDENCIVEKPREPKSNLAVTGLYCYDNKVFSYIKRLQYSNRGELEITDVNNLYLKDGNMDVKTVNVFWSDMGTVESKFKTEKFLFEKLYGKS